MNKYNEDWDPNFQFPPESDQGELSFSEETNTIQGDGVGFDGTVDLAKLEYVYLNINYLGAFIFLFDGNQHLIPLHFKGFATVYKTLDKIFGFDNPAFFSNLTQTSPFKKEIWRKNDTTNFTPISNKTCYDPSLGFGLLSDPPQLIRWETTYNELIEHSGFEIEQTKYKTKIIKSKFPISIGTIIVEELFAHFSTSRHEVPVINYYANLRMSGKREETFHILKEVFKNLFGGKKKVYELKDRLSWEVTSNDIQYKLRYQFDTDYAHENCYTALTIFNHRTYQEFLDISEYDKVMEETKNVRLSEAIAMGEDYRRNSKVKNRPSFLSKTYQDQPIIWFDEKNQKIGVSASGLAQIFDIDQIEHFTVQNIQPARGSGGSDLFAKLKGEARMARLLTGRYQALDAFVEAIKTITGKEVKVPPPYIDD